MYPIEPANAFNTMSSSLRPTVTSGPQRNLQGAMTSSTSRWPGNHWLMAPTLHGRLLSARCPLNLGLINEIFIFYFLFQRKPFFWFCVLKGTLSGTPDFEVHWTVYFYFSRHSTDRLVNQEDSLQHLIRILDGAWDDRVCWQILGDTKLNFLNFFPIFHTPKNLVIKYSTH